MKLKTLLHEFQHPMEQFHRFWPIIWRTLLHEFQHPMEQFHRFWPIIWMVFNDTLLLATDIEVSCVVRCWYICSLGFSIKWL